MVSLFVRHDLSSVGAFWAIEDHTIATNRKFRAHILFAPIAAAPASPTGTIPIGEQSAGLLGPPWHFLSFVTFHGGQLSCFRSDNVVNRIRNQPPR
jgi:hypothetical protein